MFKRCFICLLPRSCLQDVNSVPSLPQGFFTGRVIEVHERELILCLSGSITNDKEELFAVSRNRSARANAGDACYVLKRDDTELVTVPAACLQDELLCEISAITGTYMVLCSANPKERWVFPCPYVVKDPVKFIGRHALLVREVGRPGFDIILEDEKQARLQSESSRITLSEIPLMVTEESIMQYQVKQHSSSPERTPKLGIAERRRNRPLYIDTAENQDFSFSKRAIGTEKDEDRQSSVYTLEGDSGEGAEMSRLGLPESTISEDSSQKAISAIRLATKAFKRVKLSPYPLSPDQSSIATHPDLIGKHRLPLSLLKQPSITDKQIEAISEKASAWRCSESDKSSFFRCVAVGWLEYLARTTTPIGAVDQVIERLLNPVVTTLELRPGFESAAETALQVLTQLRADKARNRTTAIVYLQPVLQSRENLLSLERFLRMICVNYREKLYSTPELSPILPEDFRTQTELLASDGMDYSTLTFLALMDSLDFSFCVLKVEDADNSVNVEEYRTEGVSNPDLELLLLEHKDYFHLLYRQEDLAVDGYDLDSHSFDVLEDPSLVLK